MFNSVGLTKAEIRVIKRIARIQIISMQNIISHNSEVDMVMFCIEEELDLSQMMAEAEIDLAKYQGILECPDLIFNLDGHDLTMVKHVMWNFANKPKYDKGRRGLWRKLLYMEMFPIFLS